MPNSINRCDMNTLPTEFLRQLGVSLQPTLEETVQLQTAAKKILGINSILSSVKRVRNVRENVNDDIVNKKLDSLLNVSESTRSGED